MDDPQPVDVQEGGQRVLRLPASAHQAGAVELFGGMEVPRPSLVEDLVGERFAARGDGVAEGFEVLNPDLQPALHGAGGVGDAAEEDLRVHRVAEHDEVAGRGVGLAPDEHGNPEGHVGLVGAQRERHEPLGQPCGATAVIGSGHARVSRLG